ncbi:hypothetical protein A7P96_06565 [Eikenella sp. NML03-A-027]|nr:hypothetical protein A7P96_06565 [Eikenella sp. NML03-A-027]
MVLLWAGFVCLCGEVLSRMQMQYYQAGEQAGALFMVVVHPVAGKPCRSGQSKVVSRPLCTIAVAAGRLPENISIKETL